MRRGFSLIELLVTVAVLAVLMSILLPALGRARAQSRAVVCSSNIRQLALANTSYANDQGGRYCPGAAAMQRENLHRWHGVRTESGVAFDPREGPLAFYLSFCDGVRACPEFCEYVTETSAAFERGCGGYGYNQAYVGRVVERKSNGSFRVVSDLVGAMSCSVRRPADTLMFADAALAATRHAVIEYSFVEPRFHPEWLHYAARMDPSIHFRHGGQARVAWADGHVSAERRSFTWQSGVYEGDADALGVGWFGTADDNRLFDLD